MSDKVSEITNDDYTKYKVCLSNVDKALSASNAEITKKHAKESYLFTIQYEKNHPGKDSRKNGRERYIKALNICTSQDETNPNYRLAQQVVKDYNSEMFKTYNLKLKSKDFNYEGTSLEYLAFCDSNGNITMTKPDIKEFRKSIEEEEWNKRNDLGESMQYIYGNPIAINSVALHENKHHIDTDFGLRKLELADLCARADRMTENLANVSSYLYVAEQYQLLKQSGAKTFSYIDREGIQREMELNNMLTMFPGLEECIHQGFNPENPKDVERIVDVSTTYWHDERMENYDFQAYQNGLAANVTEPAKGQPRKTFFDLQREEKLYEQIEKRMLETVHAGYRSYNLSKYRDMLNPMDYEEATELFAGIDIVITTKKIKQLETYFNEKGIKPEEQEMYYQYVKDNISCKVNKELTKPELPDKLNNEILKDVRNILTPADVLIEEYTKNTIKEDCEKANKILNDTTLQTFIKTTEEPLQVPRTQNNNSNQIQRLVKHRQQTR